MLLLPLLLTLSAQLPEDDGPFLVGWRDVRFADTNFSMGNLDARFYYPALAEGEDEGANPAQGPYPLVGFGHGWIEPPSDYDHLCSHLASWGFVVVSTEEELGLFPRMQRQANALKASLWWTDDSSSEPSHWLEGMSDGGDWSAAGHSMGASALSYLVRDEPRVQSVVLLEPYRGSLLGGTTNGFNAFSAYSGSCLVVAGSQDLTNNAWSVVRPWFNQADAAPRNFWALINGSDHFGCTDPDVHLLWGFGSLPYADQHRIHRRLLGGFLRSEVKGEENIFFHLLGEGMSGEPVDGESSSFDPILWIGESSTSSNSMALGIAAEPVWRVRIGASLSLGSISTPWGTSSLDSGSLHLLYDANASAEGLAEILVPIPPSMHGATVYFQGLANDSLDGGLTQVQSFILP
ncbi:MAG TPA: hypothetical protein DDW23_06990 [Planctomycetes bacterium]|nr:hypothetical protein [Planctomycetota bacterium]